MKKGRASRTALRVAIRRAAHQLIDHPPVLDDPIAVRLIGPEYANDMERAQHKVGRDFRAFMAARSRYAEDHLAQAVAAGITQYVVLGAGLDTFAWRNPFPALRVFEVDFPATQEWKRALLVEAGLLDAGLLETGGALPANLTFVPLDFEHKALSEGLSDAGFDTSVPAFFSWLGVVPYLTLPAFRATLETIARLPSGSGLSFDYALCPTQLSAKGRLALAGLSKRVASIGEPFRLFFTSDEMDEELKRAGFHRTEQVDSARLNELYFHKRADGLKLSPLGLGKLVTAWV